MADRDESVRMQFRNPAGDEGLMVLREMNEHHVPLWDWCLSGMPKAADGSLLDIGCGGGGFLRRLSQKYPYSSLWGLDISPDALKMTGEVNSDLVDDGSLTLVQASVDDLPFDNGSFDLVTAMETYFFWPDLKRSISEIARVLTDGGMLFIGSEMRLTEDNREEMERASADYGTKLVTDDEMVAAIEAAGLEPRVIADDNGKWAMYVGMKP